MKHQQVVRGSKLSTFALIKPVPSSQHGKIITFIIQSGFRIVRMKRGKLDKDTALKIYKQHYSKSMMATLISYLTSGDVVGLELVGANAVRRWRECLGAMDPKEAAPGTLRYLYGENIVRNVAHASDSEENAKMGLKVFFGEINGVPRVSTHATLKNSTCCVIKPHTLMDGHVGGILDQIASCDQFHITAMAMFTITLGDAREFYEVYKSVLPEYEEMSLHLAEGKCIALEIKCKDPKINCVCEFRKLCGPRDPDLGRQLYPESIRALYGKNLVQNAVHCTDLPEDGESEVEYFFHFQKS